MFKQFYSKAIAVALFTTVVATSCKNDDSVTPETAFSEEVANESISLFGADDKIVPNTAKEEAENVCNNLSAPFGAINGKAPVKGTDYGCTIFDGTTGANLSANKYKAYQAGGGYNFMASSMMETNDLGTGYTYGDGKAGDAANFGTAKFNVYVMRKYVPEYASIKVSAGSYTGCNYNVAGGDNDKTCWKYPAQNGTLGGLNGGTLNNYKQNVRVYNLTASHSDFYATHRWGCSGYETAKSTTCPGWVDLNRWQQNNTLAPVGTTGYYGQKISSPWGTLPRWKVDIKRFEAATVWVKNNLAAGGHYKDRVKYWVNLPAI